MVGLGGGGGWLQKNEKVRCRGIIEKKGKGYYDCIKNVLKCLKTSLGNNRNTQQNSPAITLTKCLRGKSQYIYLLIYASPFVNSKYFLLSPACRIYVRWGKNQPQRRLAEYSEYTKNTPAITLTKC